MSLWDNFAWLFGRGAFSETLGGSIDRANVQYLVPADSRLYLNSWTRKQLNGKAEWVWQNFGVVKEGVAGIARHTIGKGVSLQIESDLDDGKQIEAAERDFETYALTPERCDLAGRRNLYEAQTTAIEQRLIRGEFFSGLTENPEWDSAPCFQLYDSEEIGTPDGAANAGGEKPKIIDGIELNANSAAIAYHVRGLDKSFSRIERGRMVHWYKPHAINQTRGITDFAQGVNGLVDIHELKKLATRSAKAQMLVALMLKGVKKTRSRGAVGAIQSAGRTDSGAPDPNTAQLEQLVGAAGGGICYIDDPAGDVKLITSSSPSPLVEPFITDLLIRDVCLSWGIPPEFFWNIAKLNGGNTRFILSKADLFFQILGDRLVDRFCNAVAFRYLSHRISTGKLPAFKDPNWALKLSWQMPPRTTVDNERENRILIELLSNGLITMREYCNARGLNYKAIMRQWIREPLEFIAMAKEAGADPDYIKRLSDNLPLWRAPLPGTVTAQGMDPAGKAQNDTTHNPDGQQS